MDFWRFDETDPDLGPLLEGGYDPLLVTLSIAIACLAGLTSLMLADRMIASRSFAIRRWWHIGGAITMGCGIWALHFTAMLAFSVQGHENMGYTLGLTGLSLLPAILGSGVALYCMAHSAPSMPRLLLGALLMAISIGSMHYIGMEAMHMPGLRYDFGFFGLSIVVAFLLALAALYLHFRVRNLGELSDNGVRVVAGVFMGFAVAGMHYTAMGASRFYDTAIMPGTQAPQLSNSALAATIGGFAGLILGLGLLAAWIDRQKAIQRMLEHIANTDALTGLPNRTLFRQRLSTALARSQRQDKRLAVLFMDLNDFKTINDSLGHAAGDRVLQEFATRLTNFIREDDTVARFAGDEFIVLIQDLELPEEAARTAERLLRAMQPPIEFDNWKLHADPSIGISIYPDDSIRADELIQHADAAMYRAKTEDLGYHFFDTSLTNQAMFQVRLGNDLRGALNRDQLFLHYQPLIDLRTGEWIGLEALARWQHPVEGAISPTVFIPLAERTGMITSLGEWALREACQQGRTWLDANLGFGHIAVNIAAPQLAHRGFASRLRHILQESGLPPHHLELEITETSLMHFDHETIAQLREIRSMGISLAIDDFGTGYSSLRYLKELPVDALKIDRSFINGILDDHRDQAIIRAIIDMGSSLGFSVIAEGIESEAHGQAVQAYHCHRGQGFFFSRPADADTITRVLANQTASSPAFHPAYPDTRVASRDIRRPHVGWEAPRS
ncbi:putative bifunctional diguanylate cyclase/phosphodiesterase [Aidingimonas halophila]|uniref:cyclic-guanylate-specific phosphodiesterase n=1 Tax=Aidingimonas halophila TaxID=574349 RepID=A0A1H3EZ18_9GAMM|nr:EAL domain-containing protein [Aidingimonas halophila]GHC31881.1 putative signaling protein [Aidingimonas halophila]SDX83189.1 diguanylate cyclase/phosphodiesterase [Aidingimonas halophila]